MTMVSLLSKRNARLKLENRKNAKADPKKTLFIKKSVSYACVLLCKQKMVRLIFTPFHAYYHRNFRNSSKIRKILYPPNNIGLLARET